jgi:hypothetical protein
VGNPAAPLPVPGKKMDLRVGTKVRFIGRQFSRLLRRGAAGIVSAEQYLGGCDHLGQRRHRDRIRGLGGLVKESPQLRQDPRTGQRQPVISDLGSDRRNT